MAVAAADLVCLQYAWERAAAAGRYLVTGRTGKRIHAVRWRHVLKPGARAVCPHGVSRSCEVAIDWPMRGAVCSARDGSNLQGVSQCLCRSKLAVTKLAALYSNCLHTLDHTATPYTKSILHASGITWSSKSGSPACECWSNPP
jgi:hypothetical protein